MKGSLGAAIAAAAVCFFAASTGPAPSVAVRSPSPAGLLLAPIAPLVRAGGLVMTQAALEEGRYEEAIETLRSLEALDPYDPNLALFTAQVSAVDFAERETTSAGRFARIAEALEILARVEAATGDRRLAAAAVSRLLDPWTGDPDLARRFERRYGRSPTAAAVDALARAEAAFPENGALRRRLAEARRFRAIELFVADGDFRLATSFAAAAAAAYRPHEADMPSAYLSKTWAVFFAAVEDGDAAAVQKATNALVSATSSVLNAGGAGLVECALVWSILPRLIDLGELRGATSGAAVALSLAEAADSIRRFVDSGATASGFAPVREILSRTAVVRLLEGVKTKDPSLAADADRVAANLLRISSR
jgi:tetratricopeptide (TPR) repeat protein